MTHHGENEKRVNLAYIDATNLDKALRYDLGWKLDYRKFRNWLDKKYKATRAYVFIGYIPKHESIYRRLRESGFTLVFREVVYQKGIPKGNCDSDLLIQAASDFYEGNLNKAIVVASDGDYAPLVRLLKERDGLEVIISPSRPRKCSVLLKRTGAPVTYLGDHRAKLEFEDRGLQK